jgi:Glycosyl transferase family 21
VKSSPPPLAAGGAGRRLAVSYVLPLRWHDDAGLDELTGYLDRLVDHLEDVTVVDGSPPPLFARHAARWRGTVRHVPPDPDAHYVNGKVNGVLTGLRLANHEHVIIADDDVRYDRAGLEAAHRLLDEADLVRPQNFFEPLPWHARWDTARSLLNRAVGGDYPGTLAVRRSTFDKMGGYDGDVLFENLELIRTVRAYGGHEARPDGLYVRRLPPDASRFWSQRPRQAYDDLAQPMRMAAFLAVVPALAMAVRRRRPGALTAGVVLAAALAERGRRKAGGRGVFPPSAALLAPVWVLERGVCSWVALALWAGGRGVRYGGRRIRVAANSERTLRRRRRARP